LPTAWERAETLIASFGRRGSQYDDTASRKSDLYLNFAPVVVSGRVELLVDRRRAQRERRSRDQGRHRPAT
jgi:hypothetical protein